MFGQRRLTKQPSNLSKEALVSGTLLGLSLLFEIPYTKVGANAMGKIFTLYLVSVTLPPPVNSPPNTPTVSWEVARRYSDFLELDRVLRAKLKGLAALPPKRLLSKFDDAVIAERKQGLSDYLKSALQLAEAHDDMAMLLAKFLELPGSKPSRSASLLQNPGGAAASTSPGDSSAEKTLTPDGETLHGYLFKRGGPAQSKPFRQCFCVLGSDGVLRYYRTSRPQLLGALPLRVPQARVDIIEPGLMGIPPNGFGFSIWTPERELIFYADSTGDREAWVSFVKSKFLPPKIASSPVNKLPPTPPTAPPATTPERKTHQESATPLGRKSKVETPLQQAERELQIVKRIPEDWAIDWSDLKILEKVGEGAFAKVYRGRLWGSNVAIKQLNAADGVSEPIKLALEKEIAVLSKLRHPNIVLYIGCSFITGNGAIVTEWCGRGSLFSVLKDPKQKISAREMLRLALQTARGMGYLHSRKEQIIHRDLKSFNVLITEGFEAKVADFGLTVMREAARARAETRSESRASLTSGAGSDFFGTEGTAQWMAPEVMEGSKYNHKVDIYSWGIMLSELLTRHMPFADNFQGFEFVDAVLDRAERPTIPRWAQRKDDYVDDDDHLTHAVSIAATVGPGELGALVEMCTRRDPTSRPDFDVIVERLETLIESTTPASLLANFDLPRIVESLDIGDFHDIECVAVELVDLAHGWAHPPPSLEEAPARISFAPELVKPLMSRINWGKAQRLTERGGDYDIADLPETTVKLLALGLCYVIAAAQDTRAVAKTMVESKGAMDVVCLLLTFVTQGVYQVGTALSTLKQSDGGFAQLLDKSVAVVLSKIEKSGSKELSKELGMWRLSVFGLLPDKLRSKLAGLGAQEVSTLESNVRSLEAELLRARTELWGTVKAQISRDVGLV